MSDSLAERTVLRNADRLTRLVDRGVRRALRRARTPRWLRSPSSGSASRELAELDPRFAAVPRGPRRREIGARRPGVVPAFVRRPISTRLPNGCRRSRIGSPPLERLKRKHGPTLADVLARQRPLREELARARRRAKSEPRRSSCRGASRRGRRFSTQRTRLSRRARGGGARLLARALEAGAGRAGDAEVARGASTSSTGSGQTNGLRHGIDDVEFFLSPNPGEDLRPLARIASGGELSRVMLALRTLVDVGERRPDAGVRRGGRRHRRGGRRRRRRAAAGARARAIRCSASRTCPRSPRGRAPTSRSRSDVRGGRTLTLASGWTRRAANWRSRG